MYPHRIHLREPWQTRPGEPCTYARIFNWPAELMPFEELWLIVGTVYAPFQVKLNQHLLGSQPLPRVPLELNLTKLIQHQNLLEIVCLEPPTPARVHGVRLEVRRSVHLQEIVGTYAREGTHPLLKLQARIAGIPDRKLSLVLRWDEQEILYQELGLPAGFIEVKATLPESPCWQAGQQNQLHELEVQLLDPSCIMAQHHYQTAIPTADLITSASRTPLPGEIALFESAWLTEADRTGLMVSLPDRARVLPYVWHHPCLMM